MGDGSIKKHGQKSLDFDAIIVKYYVNKKKAQLTVSYVESDMGNEIGNEIESEEMGDEIEIFSIWLVGIDEMEVLTLKYRLKQQKSVLILQFFGPNGMYAVENAFNEFITPFAEFFTSMIVPSDAVRAVVYADKVFEFVQGKDFFNFYPVIEATRFESEV